MKRLFYIIGITLLLVGCKTTAKVGGKTGKMMDYGSPRVKQELVNDQMFLIKNYATDKTYGYSEKNPIIVGKEGGGPKDERRFLNALAGPNSEEISYKRLGSCCEFSTKNGLFGDSGMLDMYEVTYEGLNKSIVLYFNMYDSDVLQVPVGFTLRK